MPLFFAEWRDPNQDNRLYQVAVLKLTDDAKTAIILTTKREIIAVHIDDIAWVRWE